MRCALFTQPFAESDSFALRGLGFGIAGTYTDQVGTATQPLLPAVPHARPVDVLRFQVPARRDRGDDRGRRAHPHRAAGLLLRRQLRLLGEYTEVSQDVSRALAERDRARRRRHQRLAVRGLVFLTGEEDVVQGLQAEVGVLAERTAPGAHSSSRPACSSSTSTTTAFGGGADSFADPAVSASKASSYRRRPQLVPEPERQVAARLRAHELRGRRRRWCGSQRTRRPYQLAPRGSASEHGECDIMKNQRSRMEPRSLWRSRWRARCFVGDAPAAAADDAAERVVRPDARALRGLQRGVRRVLEGRRPARTSTIKQSHGGSGKQARTVIDGLQADVVTLALAYDIDALAKQGKLLPANWQTRLPNNSSPYTSTIVFLVRKGNPKKIKDWGDLAQAGVAVITPNPKTSGGARWNYLAAWAWALQAAGRQRGDGRRSSSRKLYKNVPVLDTGARGSTTTFVAARHRRRADRLGERGVPRRRTSSARTSSRSSCRRSASSPSRRWPSSTSVTLRRGTTDLARAYLEYLYSPEAQEIIAKNYYRPRDTRPCCRSTRSHFPGDEAGDDRGFRRLGEGAEEALRRRRHCSTRSTRRSNG